MQQKADWIAKGGGDGKGKKGKREKKEEKAKVVIKGNKKRPPIT